MGGGGGGGWGGGGGVWVSHFPRLCGSSSSPPPSRPTLPTPITYGSCATSFVAARQLDFSLWAVFPWWWGQLGTFPGCHSCAPCRDCVYSCRLASMAMVGWWSFTWRWTCTLPPHLTPHPPLPLRFGSCVCACGIISYVVCTTRDVSTCDTMGPRLSVVDAVAFFVQILLVWLAYWLLPYSRRPVVVPVKGRAATTTLRNLEASGLGHGVQGVHSVPSSTGKLGSQAGPGWCCGSGVYGSVSGWKRCSRVGVCWDAMGGCVCSCGVCECALSVCVCWCGSWVAAAHKPPVPSPCVPLSQDPVWVSVPAARPVRVVAPLSAAVWACTACPATWATTSWCDPPWLHDSEAATSCSCSGELNSYHGAVGFPLARGCAVQSGSRGRGR